MKYAFVAWQEEGMWAAHAPSVPGVYGVGDTAKEAEDDLVEALSTMLNYMDEIGEDPPPSIKIRTGEVRV